MDTVTAAIFDWVARVEAEVETSLVKQAEVQVLCIIYGVCSKRNKNVRG